MSKSTLKLHCIAAMDAKRGIGKNNKLPWDLPKEFKYFQNITTKVVSQEKQNAVIMGKRTYLSIPEKFRPLKKRLNVVLSTTLSASDLPDNVILLPNLDAAVKFLSKPEMLEKIESVFTIGGYGVYKDTINSPNCGKIYLTEIESDFQCDVFFPEFDKSVFKDIAVDGVSQEQQEENGVKYRYHVYAKE
ncbi:dihydrofolate reductase-like [Hydractinia symbiolongicarpus]|uniref:dihydrofolate reductase-like n=1 Tax=Hydractinia symbiolongicarpus TaxID=13093 RepID=UPI00254B5B25|nr:dihydrofolate reductase-like [Hydractinia symbiolongicarpus]